MRRCEKCKGRIFKDKCNCELSIENLNYQRLNK